jgi:hypothetical protein
LNNENITGDLEKAGNMTEYSVDVDLKRLGMRHGVVNEWGRQSTNSVVGRILKIGCEFSVGRGRKILVSFMIVDDRCRFGRSLALGDGSLHGYLVGIFSFRRESSWGQDGIRGPRKLDGRDRG